MGKQKTEGHMKELKDNVFLGVLDLKENNSRSIKPRVTHWSHHKQVTENLNHPAFTIFSIHQESLIWTLLAGNPNASVQMIKEPHSWPILLHCTRPGFFFLYSCWLS